MSKEKVKKPFYKRWWVWAIAIIIVIAAFNAGGEDSSDVTNNDAEADTAAEEETTEESAEEETTKAKVGEEFELGEMTFVAESVEDQKRVGDDILGKDASGGVFKVVRVSVTNNSQEAIMMDTSYFKLIEEDGTEYSSDSEASMYVDPENNFFVEEINPKTTKTGYVAFDVPAETGSLELQVQTGFWGTETGLISLE